MGEPTDREEQYWMDRLQQLGVGPGKFRKLQREFREERGAGVSLHDTVWWMLHIVEEEAIKGLQQKDRDSAYDCLDTVHDIRLEMVWLVSMEGKDPTQHLVNMVRQVKAAVRLFGSGGGAWVVLENIGPAIDNMARDMEREGMIDAAIAVYEYRLKDVRGPYPWYYDRLRILYSKQKRYDEAIRVCRAFVDDVEWDTRTDPVYRDKVVKKFSDWIPKLEAKQRKLAQSM